MPRPPETVRTEVITLRISPVELADLDSRAETSGMSRSSYLIAAALGTLEVDPADVLGQIETLSKRIKSLEEAVFERESSW